MPRPIRLVSALREVAGGIALAELTVRTLGRLSPARQIMSYAVGLALIAAIYPATRKQWRLDRSSVAEILAVVGYSALATLGATRPRASALRLLAYGWASHAAFDLLHRHDEPAMLPPWYPGLCAGYDLRVAAHLARTARVVGP